MSRKDYTAMARALWYIRPQSKTPAYLKWAECVSAAADVFAGDSHRFSRARFYDACGVDDAS